MHISTAYKSYIYKGDYYERLNHSVSQFRKSPESKDLHLKKDWRERKAWIELLDQPAWKLVALEPISVPEQLRRHSEIVSDLINRADICIRHSYKSRVLRLIEALVREARKRRNTVNTTSAPRRDRWGYRIADKDHGHFANRNKPDAFRLTMIQKEDRVKHEPTKTGESNGWYLKYDQVTLDRLRLRIEGHSNPFRSSAWPDKPSRKPEDILPVILHEVELRAEHAE